DFDNDVELVNLGNVIEDVSEEILREIEIEVFHINKNLRREKNVKRKEIRQEQEERESRNTIPGRERRNALSQTSNIQRSGDRQTTRKIRHDGNEISPGKSQEQLHS